jgi:hypothetical protein
LKEASVEWREFDRDTGVEATGDLASGRVAMTEEQDRLITVLEKGEATPQQQKEAARMLRDLDHEVKELSDLNQLA